MPPITSQTVYYRTTNVCRSDGQTVITTKAGKELNEPLPRQQDPTPVKGMVDVYKRVASDDIKSFDWRKKLGGMLMLELGKSAHEAASYLLGEFPEGFVLWEHTKYKADGSKSDKKHNTGSNLIRQDAYLYGHVDGRRKRYRSPADFFPHLLWLGTDKDADRMNCGCKLCSPDGEDIAEGGDMLTDFKKDTKPQPPPKREFPPPSRDQSATSKPAPKALELPAGKSNTKPIQNPQASAVKSNSQTPRAQATTETKSNVLATARSSIKVAEQQMDIEGGCVFLYRPGEVVWFERAAGQGLAVVQKRRIAGNTPQYMIQPLSSPLSYPQFEIRDKQEKIRPYLAWSLPDPVVLKEYATYDSVPWERFINGEFGQPNLEIDGSILAAKAIDIGYSLFDRIDNPSAVPGDIYYNGMFLGAEKIWTGEPVRLRGYGNDPVVLVIQKLIEHTASSTSTVTFVGDVYKWVEMPTPYKSGAEWPTPKLPARMVADVRYRNEISDNAKRGLWLEWQLLEPAAKKGLADVKGRWYESRTMMPILASGNPLEYQSNLKRGYVPDVDNMMNGTGDGSTGERLRKKNRRDTLGKSVRPDFKVSRGLDGAAADDLFPEGFPLPVAQPLQQQQTDMGQFLHFE